ncbi:ABC transporter ATP-binding protein [Bdellovibrio sp. HCB337]|uniref:ABC transporter ATP-binding protein n=1 Tax=Bdellovibrio sp. HCB337 TaxID=3394358 RepID=UPI0039A70A2B
MNEDIIKTKVTYPIMFKRLWPYTRKHPWMFAAVVLIILLLTGISRLIPYIIGYAIDHGVIAKDISLFKMMALVYLGLEFSRTILSFSQNYMFQVLGNRVLYYLREDLIRHTQALPLQYFNKTPTGRTVTRIANDVSSLGDLFTDGVINIFINAVNVIAIIVAMSLISVKLTVVTLILSPLFVFAAVYLSNKIRDILREQKKKLSNINSFLAENLNGIKVVQLYNRVPKNLAQFQALSDDYRASNMQSVKSYAAMFPIMNCFTAFTITAAMYFGGWISLEGGLTIGAVVAFMMTAQDFVPPLRDILEKYQQFQNSLTSAERIFTLLDEPAEAEVKTAEELSRLNGQIEIKGLNFRYEEHLPLVLKNINLKIRAGESVALVGRTGSGKTTFISLLQRFYDAPHETIYMDGLPLEQITRHSIRSHIGVVQQDNFIFRGTIAENVSLGDPSITLQDVEKALAQTGYLDLLRRTGRDLQSPVEERGANLSVGERQLIAFARILAFDPDILILDEATANIDSESELILQKATHEVMKSRTSIIIAHRLSTVRECNRIVVLRDGEIMEVGSHQELMSQKGLYYQLANTGLGETKKEATDDDGRVV